MFRLNNFSLFRSCFIVCILFVLAAAMNLYLVSRNALRFGASVYSESELDHRRPGLSIARKSARRETPFAVAAHQRKPCPANSNRERAERESCAIDGSEAGYLSNQSLAKSRSAAMAECTVELARYCAAPFEKRNGRNRRKRTGFLCVRDACAEDSV